MNVEVFFLDRNENKFPARKTRKSVFFTLQSICLSSLKSPNSQETLIYGFRLKVMREKQVLTFFQCQSLPFRFLRLSAYLKVLIRVARVMFFMLANIHCKEAHSVDMWRQ